MKRCIIIGPMDVDIEIKKIITPNDVVFCADGGYLQAEKLKIKPDFIIGDFDSAVKPIDTTANIIALPREKDDTDTHYIAKYIVSQKYTDVLLFGMTGGRFDHTFSNLQTLNFFAENGVNAVMYDKNYSVMIIKNTSVSIMPKDDFYLSVFSFGNNASGVTLKNVKYEIENANLSNYFPIGVSNEFLDKPAYISVKNGSLLIMVIKKD